MAETFQRGMQTVRHTEGFSARQMAHAARYSWDASADSYRRVYQAITRGEDADVGMQSPVALGQDAACAV